MKIQKTIGILLITALLLTGCSAAAPSDPSTAAEVTSAAAADTETAETPDAETVTEDETIAETTEDTLEAASSAAAPQTESSSAEPELYEYQPHLYSALIAGEVPQDHWESLYHLSDALRAGKDTFECASQEAYDWCMDVGVLANLIPAAAMRISGQSDDGSAPFENGTGRIFYKMPAEEFAAREAEFEETVAEILNSIMQKDDDDYEKCLKLYDYMETNFTYEYDGREQGADEDGYVYYALKNHTGKCIDLAGAYSFLLLQAGVEAVSVGCHDGVDHEWTYAVVNGRGYHIDPTWALKDDRGSYELYLGYFMMDDEARSATGCPVSDLTVQLLPQYWASRASVSFAASDDHYYLGENMTLDSLDEENKIVHYRDLDGNVFQFHYGETAE